MSSENRVKYAVYNLRTYFSRQPADLKYCPICNGPLSMSNIAPSKVAVDALVIGEGLIAAHDFTRLYTCDACHWWGVWESWGFYECNSQADYLIVAEETSGLTDKTNQLAGPWSEILENTFVYDRAMALPDSLGALFVGGERIKPKPKRSHEPQDSFLNKFITKIARIRRKRK